MLNVPGNVYLVQEQKNKEPLWFMKAEDYLPMLQELSNDPSVAKYAAHLIYLTSANNPKEMRHKIIYSILNRKP